MATTATGYPQQVQGRNSYYPYQHEQYQAGGAAGYPTQSLPEAPGGWPQEQQQFGAGPGGASGYGMREPHFYHDPETGGSGGYEANSVWDNEKVRRTNEHNFIKKVYAIVSFQLILTFAFCSLVMTSQTVNKFMLHNSGPILAVSMIMGLVLILVIICNRSLLQRYPTNYIILGVFTITEAVLVSFACLTTTTQVVVQAVLATSFLVLGLTLFAFQTKYDFTSWMGVMFYILLGFVTFGLLKLLFFNNPTMDLVYASLGAMLFSIYLVIDTQLLLSRSQFSLSSDDYVLAALTLYLDIINIFLYLLDIFRNCSDSS